MVCFPVACGAFPDSLPSTWRARAVPCGGPWGANPNPRPGVHTAPPYRRPQCGEDVRPAAVLVCVGPDGGGDHRTVWAVPGPGDRAWVRPLGEWLGSGLGLGSDPRLEAFLAVALGGCRPWLAVGGGARDRETGRPERCPPIVRPQGGAPDPLPHGRGRGVWLCVWSVCRCPNWDEKPQTAHADCLPQRGLSGGEGPGP